MYCELSTPNDIVEHWVYDRQGEPVTIGGVTISTGDYLIAEEDRVTIIPAEWAESRVAHTEEVVSTEGNTRNAILQGIAPEEAYPNTKKF